MDLAADEADVYIGLIETQRQAEKKELE